MGEAAGRARCQLKLTHKRNYSFPYGSIWLAAWAYYQGKLWEETQEEERSLGYPGYKAVRPVIAIGVSFL